MGVRAHLIRRVDLGTIRVADSFYDRLVGLMGRRDLSGERMLFPKCRSVHTCFMLVPIDLVFIDVGRTVVRTFESVKPWRFVSGGPQSHGVVEFPAGWIRRHDIEIGDIVEWR